MFKIIAPGAVAATAIAYGYPHIVEYIETQQAQAVEVKIMAHYTRAVTDADLVRAAAERKAEDDYRTSVARADHERQTAEGVLKAKYPHARLDDTVEPITAEKATSEHTDSTT